MMWTGRLHFSGGASKLLFPNPPTVPPGIRLAIENGSPTPFFAATNFFANRNFIENEPIIVSGISGAIGNVAVIFMDDAQHGADVVNNLAIPSVLGAAKGGAKKGGAKKGDAKKGGAKKSAAKKSAVKKSAKRAARKGGKKQR